MIENGCSWLWFPVLQCVMIWHGRPSHGTCPTTIVGLPTETPRSRKLGKFPEHRNTVRTSAVQSKFRDNSMNILLVMWQYSARRQTGSGVSIHCLRYLPSLSPHWRDFKDHFHLFTRSRGSLVIGWDEASLHSKGTVNVLWKGNGIFLKPGLCCFTNTASLL